MCKPDGEEGSQTQVVMETPVHMRLPTNVTFLRNLGLRFFAVHLTARISCRPSLISFGLRIPRSRGDAFMASRTAHRGTHVSTYTHNLMHWWSKYIEKRLWLLHNSNKHCGNVLISPIAKLSFKKKNIFL